MSMEFGELMVPDFVADKRCRSESCVARDIAGLADSSDR